ncbi:MAG: YihY family inner membrane protein, partial [Bdellovibrionales bacterium]|nr:YihY family inner membrane protein [Bdellovibrionales bacterium]
AMNQIWQVYQSRGILSRITIFCAIIVLAPIFAFSLYVTSTMSPGVLFERFGHNAVAITNLYTNAFPIVIDFVSFSLVFLLVPKAPVKIKSAAVGGALSAILFYFAKTWFAIYIVRFSSYGKIYGTLASIPVFLLWLYLMWVIALFGSVVSYEVQNGDIKDGSSRSLFELGGLKAFLGFASMKVVVGRFQRGEPPIDDWQLAHHVGCSSAILKPVLARLEHAGIISHGEEMKITLQRSPEGIKLRDVLSALGLTQDNDAVFAANFALPDLGLDRTLSETIKE